MAEEQAASVQLLRMFAPLDGMKRENLTALAKKVSIRTLTAGRVLFSQGDTDKRTVWLVSGVAEIDDGKHRVSVVRGGTPEARNPLHAHLQGAGSDDWMTTLLQTNAFHRIPPANIQAIFQRLQRTPCRAGEVVIKQGAEGDYFYIIVNGKCAVTRETPLSRDGIKLAELGVGDTFGEEALIAEAKRNATVTMLTDGVLMRRNKQDFRELMNETLLQWVSYEQAREIIDKNGGKWLDVRLPSEHAN